MKIQFSSQQTVPSLISKTMISSSYNQVQSPSKLPSDSVLLRFGSDKQPESNLTEKERRLFEAIDTADFLQAVALVKAGTNVNVKKEDGVTPLIKACWWTPSAKRNKIAKFLASLQEVNINDTDKYGRTALRAAVSQRNLKVIPALLRREDIDVNLEDKEGLTPLLQSMWDGSGRTTKLLLQHPQIDVNHRDKNLEPPLLYAVQHSNAKAVKHLLTYPGINLDAQDKNGETALTLVTQQIAQDKHYYVARHQILQRLSKKQGIPVDLKDQLKLRAAIFTNWLSSFS